MLTIANHGKLRLPQAFLAFMAVALLSASASAPVSQADPATCPDEEKLKGTKSWLDVKYLLESPLTTKSALCDFSRAPVINVKGCK